MQPLTAALILALGIGLLLLGGNWIVSGSVTIARRLGWSTLLIGLTLVAFGTSAPELFFNVIAAIDGHSELSFGNVVGSNIANIGLILGIAALIHPLTVHGRVVEKELRWLVLVTLGMILLALVPPGAASGVKGHSRWDGAGMLVVFVVFMLAWYRMGRRDAADSHVRDLKEEAREEAGKSLPIAVVLFLIGLAGLIGGGMLAKEGAVSIASSLGLSEALIGLTVVAVATSLPELTTSVIACRKGHFDLAVGNVVGSNLFNILLVLGVTASIKPVAMPARGLWDLGAMGLITLLLVPIAVSNRRRIMRWEGAVLLILYFGYMTFGVWWELRGGSP